MAALTKTWIGCAPGNFAQGRGPYKPLGICIHLMQGTLIGTDNWFGSATAQVSAHYGIGKQGQIHQYVKEDDRAYHAGRMDPDPPTLALLAANPGVNPNDILIGIEHEGFVDEAWPDEMIEASARLIADIAQRWLIPLDFDHVVRHHDIYAPKACPGPLAPMDALLAKAKSYYTADGPQTT